jgi:hypothetical protein
MQKFISLILSNIMYLNAHKSFFDFFINIIIIKVFLPFSLFLPLVILSKAKVTTFHFLSHKQRKCGFLSSSWASHNKVMALRLPNIVTLEMILLASIQRKNLVNKNNLMGHSLGNSWHTCELLQFLSHSIYIEDTCYKFPFQSSLTKRVCTFIPSFSVFPIFRSLLQAVCCKLDGVLNSQYGFMHHLWHPVPWVPVLHTCA